MFNEDFKVLAKRRRFLANSDGEKSDSAKTCCVALVEIFEKSLRNFQHGSNTYL